MSFVVAPDDRRHAVAHETLELTDVSIDRFGRPKGESDIRLCFARIDRRDRPKPADRLERDVRRIDENVATGGILAATASEIDMMLCVVPRSPQFGFDVRTARYDEQRVGREQRQDGSALKPLAGVLAHKAVNR